MIKYRWKLSEVKPISSHTETQAAPGIPEVKASCQVQVRFVVHMLGSGLSWGFKQKNITECRGPGQRLHVGLRLPADLPCGFMLLLLRAWHQAAHPHCGWPPSGRCPISKPRGIPPQVKVAQKRLVPQDWRPTTEPPLLGNARCVTVMSSCSILILCSVGFSFVTAYLPNLATCKPISLAVYHSNCVFLTVSQQVVLGISWH